MNISRRSFLKLAGLTTVAAASASMFTGCGSLKPVTIVYIYEGTDAGIKDQGREPEQGQDQDHATSRSCPAPTTQRALLAAT